MNEISLVLVDELLMFGAPPNRAHDVSVHDVITEGLGGGEGVHGLARMSGGFLEQLDVKR
jgi:hypothetical protein